MKTIDMNNRKEVKSLCAELPEDAHRLANVGRFAGDAVVIKQR